MKNKRPRSFPSAMPLPHPPLDGSSPRFPVELMTTPPARAARARAASQPEARSGLSKMKKGGPARHEVEGGSGDIPSASIKLSQAGGFYCAPLQHGLSVLPLDRVQAAALHQERYGRPFYPWAGNPRTGIRGREGGRGFCLSPLLPAAARSPAARPHTPHHQLSPEAGADHHHTTVANHHRERWGPQIPPSPV